MLAAEAYGGVLGSVFERVYDYTNLDDLILSWVILTVETMLVSCFG